jgi:5-methylcytosine-specific restriction endonuclease McrA
MQSLHIVQGGISNGDKEWLKKAARKKLTASTWVAPKSALPGDDVVIYVSGYGFFATATIHSYPKPRPDWPNRYGAGLTSINLIEPAISLSAILRKTPDLKWAKYPRSIATPKIEVANQVRELISLRRKTGLPDLDEDALNNANIDELRKVALLKARPSMSAKQQKSLYRASSYAIKRYVLLRSNGYCEGCKQPAPFQDANGNPYLEAHHTLSRADDGPDHPKHVIALCPNCHRRVHYARDGKGFNNRLIKTLNRLEPE